jgi:hypothetical protein
MVNSESRDNLDYRNPHGLSKSPFRSGSVAVTSNWTIEVVVAA